MLHHEARRPLPRNLIRGIAVNTLAHRNSGDGGVGASLQVCGKQFVDVGDIHAKGLHLKKRPSLNTRGPFFIGCSLRHLACESRYPISRDSGLPFCLHSLTMVLDASFKLRLFILKLTDQFLARRGFDDARQL